jgi:hypothetical protein
MVVEEISQMHNQVDSVTMINEYIKQIQRGIIECQPTFEILVDAFLHAQDGVIQPQLITIFFYWRYNPLWVCILQPSIGL